MQCIESILNQLTEQILILAASLTFRGHEAGRFLALILISHSLWFTRYVLNEITRGLAPFLFAGFEFSWDSVLHILIVAY